MAAVSVRLHPGVHSSCGVMTLDACLSVPGLGLVPALPGAAGEIPLGPEGRGFCPYSPQEPSPVFSPKQTWLILMLSGSLLAPLNLSPLVFISEVVEGGTAVEALESPGDLSPLASDSRYNGLCLLDAIDSLQPPLRDISKPLRLPICDVIKSHSVGHVSASGKLDTGAIRNGTKVLVMPSGDIATVRSIERDARTCTVARAGDNVAVVLQGIDTSNVMPGSVLCHPEFPVAVASCLELKVLVLDVAMPILVGSEVEFHIHHVREAARVSKISSVIDAKTGKISKKAARFLSAKQSAIIEVVLEGAVCVEEFSKCRALGRVFLRASGNTVAVGIVTRVVQEQ
ncbi:hypothetical protein Taro_029773 [Colocasia esculenta]|uniref:Translation elongation factor EFTu/EF1A C-terminal domain-containing protein n=1 Tax=Colocasia esculenta TaxID=4460 RepID=A0A843VS50_COLES|nr:hypothetical protein [Colocasia esculenta]